MKIPCSAISRCTRIQVTEHRRGRGADYTAFLREAGEGGGRWVSAGYTPRAAVRAVIAKAQKEIAVLNAILKDLPDFGSQPGPACEHCEFLEAHE